MKVIDLLNTPLNKLPQKIRVGDNTYTLYIDEDTNYHYYQDDKCKYFMFSISCFEALNDEVEIIEEDKKIEKITVQDLLDLDTGSLLKRIVDNQNELIDEVNKLKEKYK